MPNISIALQRANLRVGAVLVGIAVVLMASPPSQAVRPAGDPSVSQAIEKKFLFDNLVPFDSIDVEARDGIVTLSGTASNLVAMERAVRIAERVKGVRAVINQISVKPHSTRPLDDIENDVVSALLTNPATDSYEIAVSLAKVGEVTLSGVVESWAERDIAERVAKSVRGVTAVENAIRIVYDTERSDSEIKPDVEERLRWNVLVDHGLIDVRVEDGKVSLTGTVGSAAEKRAAQSISWVAGVSSVDAAGLEVDRWARDDDLRKDKYVIKSDELVETAIRDALSYDPRVESSDISVQVENGAATLRGIVHSLAAKRAAEQTARNTVGAIGVLNYLKVRQAAPVSDVTIAENVRAGLERDPIIERSDVAVRVLGGVVHLHGDVDYFSERARADEIAANVKGVVRVDNKLTVANRMVPFIYDRYQDPWPPYRYAWYDYQPYYSWESDSRIEDAIKAELWWSPFVDSDEVEVEVDNGIATLTGTVDTWAERNTARENAYEGGAIWVINELAVKQEAS